MKARAKPQRLGGLAQPGNLGIDFSDVRDGLERLDDCRDEADERELVGEKLMQELAALPRTVAGVADLHDAIGATVMYGDPVAPALEALGRVAFAFAGHSGLAAVDKAQRRQSASHGEKGGRPESIWAEDWSRSIDLMRAANPKLTQTAAYQKLAREWREEVTIGGEVVQKGRSWGTIRDAVCRYRKETKG